MADWGGSSVHGYVILSRPRRYTPIVETAGRARQSAAKESIAEANGAYDQVLAMLSGANA
ncbi:hypothetical protein [Nonomuraea sp. NPDC049480]|uniref:hypothetical protein n=1 Tax=Nonomuraea sp. NPDC049480 TaxID=3364353 RepID=UPI003788B90A